MCETNIVTLQLKSQPETLSPCGHQLNSVFTTILQMQSSANICEKAEVKATSVWALLPLVET